MTKPLSRTTKGRPPQVAESLTEELVLASRELKRTSVLRRRVCAVPVSVLARFGGHARYPGPPHSNALNYLLNTRLPLNADMVCQFAFSNEMNLTESERDRRARPKRDQQRQASKSTMLSISERIIILLLRDTRWTQGLRSGGNRKTFHFFHFRSPQLPGPVRKIST